VKNPYSIYYLCYYANGGRTKARPYSIYCLCYYANGGRTKARPYSIYCHCYYANGGRTKARPYSIYCLCYYANVGEPIDQNTPSAYGCHPSNRGELADLPLQTRLIPHSSFLIPNSPKPQTPLSLCSCRPRLPFQSIYRCVFVFPLISFFPRLRLCRYPFLVFLQSHFGLGECF